MTGGLEDMEFPEVLKKPKNMWIFQGSRIGIFRTLHTKLMCNFHRYWFFGNFH